MQRKQKQSGFKKERRMETEWERERLCQNISKLLTGHVAVFSHDDAMVNKHAYKQTSIIVAAILFFFQSKAM